MLPEGRADLQAGDRGIPGLGQRVPAERLAEGEQADGDASQQGGVDERARRLRRPALGPDQKEEGDAGRDRQEPHPTPEVSEQALPRRDRRGGRDRPPRQIADGDPAEDAAGPVAREERRLGRLADPSEPCERRRRHQDRERPGLGIVVRAGRVGDDQERHAEHHGAEADEDRRARRPAHRRLRAGAGSQRVAGHCVRSRAGRALALRARRVRQRLRLAPRRGSCAAES